jgi:hypothetical protein
MKPIELFSYRVRVKYSLVLLEMFSHPVQLWCRRIPIRIVIWGHPSSCLENLKCLFIYKDCGSILTALRNKVEKSATIRGRVVDKVLFIP